MLKTIFKYFVELTGNPISSSILKSFTKSRMSRPLIRPFAKVYKINHSEMELPIGQYKSLHAFFTRNLKQDLRPIDQNANTLVSPVDGIISDMGSIDSNEAFYIKGQYYDIKEILGSKQKAASYKDGYFFLIYLSPKHYHRIHYPINGELISRYALGEKSFPVNDLGMRWGNKPFSSNYRLISELTTAFGNVAVIKVGALNINSIQLVHADTDCRKGDEIGYFSFGSTVILFVEKKLHWKFEPCINKNSEITMGKPIGKWTNPE